VCVASFHVGGGWSCVEQANATVTRLDVSFALVENGDAYATAVAAALSEGCDHLITLLMRSNRLGDPAAVALAAMLQVKLPLVSVYRCWVCVCVCMCDDNEREGGRGGCSADLLICTRSCHGFSAQVNATLTALDLMGNDIGDNGVGALATALPDSGTLRLLNISHNAFGWPGVGAMAAAFPRNHTLQHVSMSGPYQDQPIEPADTVDKLLAALQVGERGVRGRQVVEETILLCLHHARQSKC
jgi:hypothetical protein